MLTTMCIFTETNIFTRIVDVQMTIPTYTLVRTLRQNNKGKSMSITVNYQGIKQVKKNNVPATRMGLKIYKHGAQSTRIRPYLA